MKLVVQDESDSIVPLDCDETLSLADSSQGPNYSQFLRYQNDDLASSTNDSIGSMIEDNFPLSLQHSLRSKHDDSDIQLFALPFDILFAILCLVALDGKPRDSTALTDDLVAPINPATDRLPILTLNQAETTRQQATINRLPLRSALNVLSTCRTFYRQVYCHPAFWCELASTMYGMRNLAVYESRARDHETRVLDAESTTHRNRMGYSVSRTHGDREIDDDGDSSSCCGLFGLSGWDEKGAMKFEVARRKFKLLDSDQLDLKHPIRITLRLRRQEEAKKVQSDKMVVVWDYLGMGLFWETLFAFCLFGFFVFLPICADGLIPGFELFHLALFFIIPVALYIWNFFLSLVFACSEKMKIQSSSFDERFKSFGCLFISTFSWFLHSENMRSSQPSVSDTLFRLGLTVVHISCLAIAVMLVLAAFQIISLLIPFALTAIPIICIYSAFGYSLLLKKQFEDLKPANIIDFAFCTLYFTCLFAFLVLFALAIDYQFEWLKFYIVFIPVNIIQASSIFTIAINRYWHWRSEQEAEVFRRFVTIHLNTPKVVNSKLIAIFVALSFVFGYFEFVLVWKLDVGFQTFWSLLYLPPYLAIVGLFLYWLYLRKDDFLTPRHEYVPISSDLDYV